MVSRRQQALPAQADAALLNRQIAKLRQGIERLIDGYSEGYIDKGEFEPRIRRFKERIQTLESQAQQLHDERRRQAELQLIIGRVEEFAAKVSAGLERFDWSGRRELIRTLVKRTQSSHAQRTSAEYACAHWSFRPFFRVAPAVT